MVETATLQPIANVLKLFGNNGTVAVKFRSQAYRFFNESEPVFAIMEGIPVPFFIATCQPYGNDKAYILFDYIYRQEQALELIGKTLYQTAPNDKRHFDKRHFDKLNVTAVRPHALIGFTVSDMEKGPLGHVDAFIDWEMNPCLSIQRIDSAQTFLVPFHQALIRSIDVQNRHITLLLPEGLLDV